LNVGKKMALKAISVLIENPSFHDLVRKPSFFTLSAVAGIIKNITIVNDTFKIVRITIISDATTWSITYGRQICSWSCQLCS
jgi:hypothetical protein